MCCSDGSTMKLDASKMKKALQYGPTYGYATFVYSVLMIFQAEYEVTFTECRCACIVQDGRARELGKKLTEDCPQSAHVQPQAWRRWPWHLHDFWLCRWHLQGDWIELVSASNRCFSVSTPLIQVCFVVVQWCICQYVGIRDACQQRWQCTYLSSSLLWIASCRKYCTQLFRTYH